VWLLPAVLAPLVVRKPGAGLFAELMAAVGSRDGREVVRMLGGLRDKLALDRDGEGRYVIKPGAPGSR